MRAPVIARPGLLLAAAALVLAGSAGAQKLYLTSLDSGNSTFSVYDPGTNMWTPLNPFDTGAQMAVSGTGDLYAWNRSTGQIQLYDDVTDTWSNVLQAPVGANGSYGNLEITNAGEFFYSENNNMTLFYTVNQVWQTANLGFNGNCLGDYDPINNQYVIGQRSTGNAHLIDVVTLVITTFSNGPQNNGEYARFSVVMNGRYYYQFGSIGIHSFDLASPAAAAVDHTGPYGAFYHSAAGDRTNGIIYVSDLNGSGLRVFDPVTFTLTPMTSHPAIGNHSSLAFVEPVAPPTCTLTSPPPLVNGDVTIGLDSTSASSPTVDVLFEYSLDGGMTWSTCTATVASPLTNPALGVPVGPTTFEWDSRTDGVGLFAVAPGVLVQATVDDGIVPTTGQCVTSPFDVDNSIFCNGVCGDCDQNGQPPDILDALVAAQIGALVVTPTGQQIPCCDADGSGAIDVLDALLMAQSAALLPVTLACP